MPALFIGEVKANGVLHNGLVLLVFDPFEFGVESLNGELLILGILPVQGLSTLLLEPLGEELLFGWLLRSGVP